MNFKDKIYSYIISTKKEFSDKELFKELGFYSDFERKTCRRAIKELEAEGRIFFNEKTKKYHNAQKSNAIRGKVSGNKRGYAFIIPEDSSINDIFIAPRNLNGAMHNDTVLCSLLGAADGKSDEGKVVSVIERGTEIVVGEYIPSAGYGFVVPDDARYFSDIFIPHNDLKAQKGDKVVVKITSFPKNKRNPEGKITEILGGSDQASTDILAIIRSYGLYEEFNQKTLAYVKKISTEISEAEKAGREDFTNSLVITIDGEDAKDLDDAVSVSKKGNLYELCVHIADVSHYVKENSPIDVEAVKRGTSVYFPDRVLPMLPKELSNGICSLNPKVDRLTLSVIMNVDKEGKVVSSRISETVIKTAERMTYTSVQKILDCDEEEVKKYRAVVPMITLMKELALILIEKRGRRGSIDFDLPEAKITVDGEGNVTELKPYPRELSNKIIEEFMILANETVAKICFDKELPFVYRVHEKPNEEKMTAFKVFLNSMGYDIKVEEAVPLDFSDLLGRIEGKPEFSIINKVMLRTMMKAKYSPNNIGHFGLASEFYCHFTSPIRRYPDLMIHRIIKENLLGKNPYDREKSLEKVAQISLLSSEREKLAEEAERDAEDYFKAKYMSAHIGEEFDGIISGVTEFGVFVELQNTAEGLVRTENLPDDDYEYFKEQYTLKGIKHVFKLGEKLKIRVVMADTASKKIDFELA